LGLQATNAGIDFQQRISAFMMILMEFEIDISMVLQLNSKEKIIELNFEACKNIDDLVITLESGKKIYFQMKRTISLSENENSEFYGVCAQFVRQYLTQNSSDLAYILTTRSEASNAITVKLKRVLEGIRLSHDLKVINDLNQEEKSIFDKLCNNIKKIYKSIKQQDISNEKLLELLLRMYVEIFDIESGEDYEKNIKLILFNKVHVDVVLFWGALIAKAIDYGAKRRCISKDVLKTQFDIYISENHSSENISEQFLTHKWASDVKHIDVKLDYVVAIPTETTKQEMDLKENTVFAFELYRFNDSERKKSLMFETPNIMKLAYSKEFKVLFRCGSQDRFHKYIEGELSQIFDNKYELLYCPIKEFCDDTEVELLHKEILIKSLESQKECKCINCGKAVFEDNAYIIEIDNKECNNTAGMVHNRCVRPVDRIIGEIKIPKIEDYAYLKNFDINTWAKLIKKGKQAWGNIDKLDSKYMPIMAINTDEVFHDGNYCICSILKNGDKRYSTHRGVIDRLSKREAEKLQRLYNDLFMEGRAANDPFGYSSESFAFSRHTQLIKQFGDKESFLECVEVKIELYNEIIAKIYNDCETYYAPIIYLAIDGEPLVLPNNCFPMITNPFNLQKYLDNWSNMGIDISNYEVCIIKDDNEFILKMISLIMNDIRPVVNGFFSSDGELLKGTMMYLMLELKAEHEASINRNENNPMGK